MARKNLPRLLRAYAAYREGAPEPWRLVMLGDGPERGALEQMARRIGGVTFAGFRQIEELPAYYGRAGAFVHPLAGRAVGAGGQRGHGGRHAGRGVGPRGQRPRPGERGARPASTFDPESVPDLAARLTEVSALDADDRRRIVEAAQARVEGWSPEAFAEGLWDAVRAGQDRARRGPSAALVGILHTMWALSRRCGELLRGAGMRRLPEKLFGEATTRLWSPLSLWERDGVRVGGCRNDSDARSDRPPHPSPLPPEGGEGT